MSCNVYMYYKKVRNIYYVLVLPMCTQVENVCDSFVQTNNLYMNKAYSEQ